MAFSGTDNYICTPFKLGLLSGTHNFASGGHTFRMALYDNTAAPAATTTVYPGAGVGGELAATGNYTQGGEELSTNAATTSGTTAYADWTTDPYWSTATFTAYGALIYNDTHASDEAVMWIDFAGAKSVSNGTFTVTMPTADASNAILRLA
jgi:hypothetical protein